MPESAKQRSARPGRSATAVERVGAQFERGVGLSRRQHRFESGRGRQSNQRLADKRDDRCPGSVPETGCELFPETGIALRFHRRVSRRTYGSVACLASRSAAAAFTLPPTRFRTQPLVKIAAIWPGFPEGVFITLGLTALILGALLSFFVLREPPPARSGEQDDCFAGFLLLFRILGSCSVASNDRWPRCGVSRSSRGGGELRFRNAGRIDQSGERQIRDDRRRAQLPAFPRQPVLGRRLKRHVSGIAMPGGHIDWTFGRARGFSL
jgi:hypothetical protein